MASELDWKKNDAGVSEVLSGWLGGQSAEVMGQGRSAGFAWNSVNGDIERAHTTGVFLTDAWQPGEAQVLNVYVDTLARSVDFRANREIYLARLRAAGYEYSDVRFLVNKRARQKAPAKAATNEKSVTSSLPPELPEQTPEERARVDLLASQLPASLRKSFSKAMSSSLRRDRLENS